LVVSVNRRFDQHHPTRSQACDEALPGSRDRLRIGRIFPEHTRATAR